MKRKLLSIITATVLVCTMLISASAASFASGNDSQTKTEEVKSSPRHLSQSEFANEIKKLEQGLIRSEDGTFTLTVKPEVARELGLNENDIKNISQG